VGDLRGRVALVTGPSTATALAGCGATVVVNSASSVAAGERLVADPPSHLKTQKGCRYSF